MLSTHQGVDQGAFVAFKEIQATIQANPQFTSVLFSFFAVMLYRFFPMRLRFSLSLPSHISLIGHSLGGMYARYTAYLLDQAGVFAKLRPVTFMTMATPHLGNCPRNGGPKHTNLFLFLSF
jgi:triacylglycerol esterase/lipase EstA (alpha/beta hydrolase family)